MNSSIKANKLFVVLFLIIAMVISLFPPIGSLYKAEAAAVTVDGSANDWSGINSLVTNTGTAKSLKATNDGTNLYLFVEGAGLSTVTGSFWLDTDNNPATGYKASGWGANGVEWMLENNTLYSYSGDGTSWSWDLKTTLDSKQMSRSGSAVEALIPLSTLKMNVGSTLKLGYIDNRSEINRLPAANGTLPAYVMTGEATAPVATTPSPVVTAPEVDKPAGKITVDGNGSDWSEVKIAATNGGASSPTLKITNDETNLYLLLNSNKNVNKGTVWLDADNNPSNGFNVRRWNLKADWKIENGSLFKYEGMTNNTPKWTKVTVDHKFSQGSSVLEASILLSALNSTMGSKVKVGYDNVAELERLPSDILPTPSHLLVTEAEASKSVTPTTVTNNLVEMDSPLNNPFKGWAPSAKTTSYSQPVKLVYAGVTWKELEPTKGNYNFEAIEKTNNFAYWKSKGVKVVFRLIMDNPTGQAHRDIPDWLYNEIVAAGQSPGTAYSDTTGGMGAGNNTGFSPNYSAPSVIQGHKLLLEAIANRYYTNERPVAFVQIGSLGHWGEFHTWPYNGPSGVKNYTGVFPTFEVSNQYVQQYLDAFAGKEDKIQVLIRRSVELATNNNKGMKLGMFNDVFGDKASFDADWGWYTGTQNGYWDDLGQKQPGNPNFWDSRISAGEFYSGEFGMKASLTSGSGFDETLRQTEMSKISWLGPNSPAALPVGNSLQANMDTLKKKMGYHFVLKQATYPSLVTGGSLPVNLTIENKGMQHFPFNWKLEVFVYYGKNLVSRTATNADLTTWKTGTHKVDVTLPVEHLPSGNSYEVYVGIMNPETSLPGVDFANEGKHQNGTFKLGNITK
ncbi:protein of unknown function [Paenibacillaceae bacterium GAS479]|nr:protein of unknown function [Paenibacillaceae bacterium GAS479]